MGTITRRRVTLLAAAAAVRAAVSAAGASAGRRQLVDPGWEWEPAQAQWVQHCLQVPTVNGSWDHEVLNRSDHSWPMVNESVTWANNSRLLTLAVPEGTPPPGGWPVLMDLLVVDYPTRSPSDRGVDKDTAQQICGLDGGTFADKDQNGEKGERRSQCVAAARTACGAALSGDYATCVGCMDNVSVRAKLLGPTPPSGASWTGPCSPGLLEQLTFAGNISGPAGGGGLCPPAPPLPAACEASIEAKCGWTKVMRNASAAAAGKERIELWREYSRNCSSCVEHNFSHYLTNTSLSGCPSTNGTQTKSASADMQQMLDGFCELRKPPWAHKRGNFFTDVRYFWPFSSPQRMAMGCSCINTSKFTCAPPADDGHLGQEYVPPGGFCDSDLFFGAIWFQRVKQYCLLNGIAVMEVNNFIRDGWESWGDIWNGGYDPPFFAALVDAMNGRPHRTGLLPSIGGAAGPMLSSLNPNKIIFRGWSGSAHMVSWLIQAVATKQLTGIGIAAGLMFSGGSMGCFNEPPYSVGSCKVCNTSIYNSDPNALGCSNTYKKRGLAQPYCQLCCPTNFTEPYYNEHPAEYPSHPPTFLTQTTVDFCSDSCAAKNYHETMIAHGGHSHLALVPLSRQRCYALGTPGDPSLPKGAAQWARFCDDQNYTSMNHTQGFSAMVEPLAQFLVDAVERKPA